MPEPDIRIATLSADQLDTILDDIARLRIKVFRAYPYLYDGDMAYERDYLRDFAASKDAIVVGAWDGETLIGAATGAPLEDHADAFGKPFSEHGYKLEEIFYCAESVLLPQYRGRGIGHAFFDHRERKAQEIGRRYATFCAVVRSIDHPLRPSEYRALDGFWSKRGYAPIPGLVAKYTWKDIDLETETEKEMQFWLRRLFA